MDDLEKVYDKLIDNFKTVFTTREVQSWRWSTWSEFNCKCSFKGSTEDDIDKTVAEALEVVRRGVRATKKHGLSLRLGDFTGLIPGTIRHDEKELFFRKFILAMKNDSELNILRDTPGVGISIYHENPYKVAEGIRNMREILTEYGYSNLPIHIDQLGYSSLTVDGQKKKTYQGEPGIYGTSMDASFFHELIYNNSLERIGDIHLWHRYNKLAGSFLVRTSRFHLYNWLYELRNHRKLPAQGKTSLTDSTSIDFTDSSPTPDNFVDSIRTINAESQDRTVFTSIVIRHSKDFRATGQKTVQVCFNNLPDGTFEVTHFALDKNNGNTWETLLGLWSTSKDDSFDYYNDSNRNYEFPTGFFYFHEPRLTQLQLAAEPTRISSYRVNLSNHRYCRIVTLESHAVHKIQLTKK